MLIVSNGAKEGLTGSGCFFVRQTNKAITLTNLPTDVSFGLINANILPSLSTIVKHVVVPALSAQENWGVLQRKKDESIKQFMETLDRFVGDLDVAMVNLHDSVQLQPCTIDLEAYKKPSDYVNAAHEPEVVAGLEALVNEWCKQIEQVLAESEQMRKEADDIGPNAELGHWKARMVKFNSITDQLKSTSCKKVIGILNAVKSKNLKNWKDLDNRVTDAANESKDNVKYLYTLERFCEPLYSSDPLGMIPSIPGLINAIKMIYSISRYYNTSERMTSLFVKITNQMITSCKEYIYKDGGAKLWEQDVPVLIKRLTDCVKLNENYQRCFHDTKVRLLSPFTLFFFPSLAKILTCHQLSFLNRKNSKKRPTKNNSISRKCTFSVNLTPSANVSKKSLICSTPLRNSACWKKLALKVWTRYTVNSMESFWPCKRSPTTFWITVKWNMIRIT